MSISFTKYVDITSGVAAASQIANANFGGRLFTPNHIASVDGIISASDAESVGALFGTASEEYKRAAFYFGFIAKTIRAPQQLQFARWQREATSPSIYGASDVSALASLNLITAGVINFLFGTTEVSVTGIDFASDGTLAAVAATLQTALQAETTIPELATATVAYDPVMQRFNFVGSSTVTAHETISIVSVGGGNTDVALALGWDPSQTPQYVSSSPIVTPVQTYINSVAGNNNFGGALFINNGGTGIQMSDAVAIATQNKTYNVMYKFHVGMDDSEYSTWSAALATIGGTVGIYQPDSLASQYHDMMDMIINASTDYTQTAGAQGYMYNEFDGLTPSVTTDALSTTLDTASINYYGQTQINGTDLQFYQDGVMFGGPTDPTDSNVYANEMWLKRYAIASYMSLQLALPKIDANVQGIGLFRTNLTSNVIPAAKANGTISVGKPLNIDQQLYITQQTGDQNAWQTVQNTGVWYNVTLSSYVAPNGSTRWQINYTLIYSKDDLVRKVVGSHVLI
jgi:hypothetical protein